MTYECISAHKGKRKYIGHDVENAHEAEMYPERHYARRKGNSITRSDYRSQDNACYDREHGQEKDVSPFDGVSGAPEE